MTRTIIDEIAEISATVPDEEWREEPRNASKRVGEEAPCLCDQITFSQCWVIATRPYVGKIVYDRFYHWREDAEKAFAELELSPKEYHVYSVLIGFDEQEWIEGKPAVPGWYWIRYNNANRICRIHNSLYGVWWDWANGYGQPWNAVEGVTHFIHIVEPRSETCQMKEE